LFRELSVLDDEKRKQWNTINFERKKEPRKQEE